MPEAEARRKRQIAPDDILSVIFAIRPSDAGPLLDISRRTRRRRARRHGESGEKAGRRCCLNSQVGVAGYCSRVGDFACLSRTCEIYSSKQQLIRALLITD
jgi:hypothetical protein